MSKLLTTEELAEALNVSVRTVKNWLEGDVIPAAIREGKVLRFDIDKVKTALAKRAAKKTAAMKPRAEVPAGMVLTY